MGATLSKISLRVFEFFNELFIAIASGAVGIVILTVKGLSEAHYFRTIFVTTVTVGCLIYVFQSNDLIEPSADKVVFITGCDSGLGFSLAQHISDLGFTVVAGCLKTNSKGARELKKNSKIILVGLDITKEEDVNTAVETVSKYLESSNYNLWALINNAGCMVFGEFEWQTHSLIRQQVEVNLLGTFRITKDFCPLLRKYKARLIIISSHCALAPLPGLSVYGATKAGLLAWSDGLRVELGKYGIAVVSFVPGSFVQSSNIMARQNDHVYEMNAAFTSEQKKFYGDYFKRYNSYLGMISGPSRPVKIDDPRLYEKFERALMTPKPNARYVNETMRYRIFHTIFKYSPTCVRDFFVSKFMQMPKYTPEQFVPDALA